MREIEYIPHSEGFCNECGQWTEVMPREVGELSLSSHLTAYLCEHCFPHRPVRFLSQIKKRRAQYAAEGRLNFGIMPVHGGGQGPRVWESMVRLGEYRERKFAGNGSQQGRLWPHPWTPPSERSQEAAIYNGVYQEPDQAVPSKSIGEIAESGPVPTWSDHEGHHDVPIRGFDRGRYYVPSHSDR